MSDTASTDATQDVVLTDTRDHILLITINREAAFNSINSEVSAALGSALEGAQNDPDVRVVLLTGAGEKAFCAGADLKALARGESVHAPVGQGAEWGFAGIAKHPISKPLIAVVNGFALGGGTEIALACDLVLAAENAKFGLPEVGRGIIAAAGGAFRLPQQIPRKLAMEILLTGEPISADQALSVGLINRVTTQAELLPEAMRLAATIAANAPLAVQATKRIVNLILDGMVLPEEQAWEVSGSERAFVMSTDDAKEGPRAFAEKRKPKWANS